MTGLVERQDRVFGAAGRCHSIIIDLASDLPGVTAEARRFGQVPDNLLTNAVRHSPEGSSIPGGGGSEGCVWRSRSCGAMTLPDSVLEVDHTNDVGPNKLPVYEACGFPKVWGEHARRAVAEPTRAPAARPDDLRAGGEPLSHRGRGPCVPHLGGRADPTLR